MEYEIHLRKVFLGLCLVLAVATGIQAGIMLASVVGGLLAFVLGVCAFALAFIIYSIIALFVQYAIETVVDEVSWRRKRKRMMERRQHWTS